MNGKWPVKGPKSGSALHYLKDSKQVSVGNGIQSFQEEKRIKYAGFAENKTRILIEKKYFENRWDKTFW